MPFDYQAAIKAGKTKQEIIKYLAETRNISEGELQKQWLSKGEDFALRHLSRFKPQEKTEAVETPEKTGGVLGFLGDIIGIEKLGRGIGARLASSSKEYQKNLQTAIDAGIITEEQAQQLRIGGVSDRALVGSAIQGAATVASLGIGGAGAGALNTAKVLGKVGAAGAVAGFGAGLSEDKSVGESLEQAFTTGLTSAATAGAFTALGKLGSVALKRLPTKIFASVAKLDKETAKVLINDRQMGTLGRIKAIADKEVDSLNDAIASKITAESGKFNSKDFLKKVFNSIKGDWQGVDEKKIKAAMKASDISPFLNDKTVDFATADNIRKGIGKTLGTVWKSDNPKFNHDVKMAIWKEIVNTIRPVTGTVDEFARLEAYTKASMRFAKVINNQEQKFGLKFSDLVLGGFGTIGGGGVGAVGTVAAKKAAESSAVRTSTAVGLNEVNKLIEKIPAKYFDKAGRISRAALVRAVSEVTGGEQLPSQ